MRMQERIVDVSVATNCYRVARPRVYARGLILLAIGAPLMFFSVPMHSQAAATPSAAPSMVQTGVKLVIGNESIKNNSVGTLSVVGSSLQFAAREKKLEVEASSILDISTDKDSRQDITGAAHLAAEAIPYGGSRVLSLFSHEVDVLTVEFKDASGGYHGTVFVLAQGKAAQFKKQLVTMGAKATLSRGEPAPANK